MGSRLAGPGGGAVVIPTADRREAISHIGADAMTYQPNLLTQGS
jgi:hypothetical protein